MEKASYTIKDIAAMAGVSIGTVDRVIHKRGNVSAQSEAKVKEVLSRIDYEPCSAAKVLALRKKGIVIGITYPEIDCEFWNEIAEGIKEAESLLSSYGVSFIVHTSSDYSSEGQREAISYLLDQGVSGIIIGAVVNFALDDIEACIPESIPFATIIDKTSSPRSLFHVGPDDMALGTLAAKLMSLYAGSEQLNVIVVSSNNQFIGSQLRIAGFVSKATSELENLTLTQTIVGTGLSDGELNDDLYLKVKDVLQKYPQTNAFYVMNGIFDGVARAVDESGRDDIIMITHESTAGLKDYLDRGIVKASIYQHPARQIFLAIRLLFKYLTGNEINNRVFYSDVQILIKETYSLALIGKADYI